MRAWTRMAALTLALASAGRAGAAPALEAWSINVEPVGFEHTGEGIAPSFLQYLSDAADVPLAVAVRPYLRVLEGLRTGQIAMTILIPTPEGERTAFVLCRVAPVRVTVLYRRDLPGGINGVEGLAGRTIGIMRGSKVLAAYASSMQFHGALVNSQEQGMRMMQAGRLDGTMCVHPGCRAALRSAGLEADDYGEVVLGNHQLALMVSRASPLASDRATLSRLRTACESKNAQRLMASLLARWE